MSMNVEAYAQALYDLAKEQSLEDVILQQVETLSAAFAEEPDYLRLLSSHSLSKQERCKILDDGFRDKLQPYLLNFLKLMTEKGYINKFESCSRYYRNLYNDDHGILSVLALTALPLTERQKERLSRKLADITGKQIQLINRVDTACIGGVRISYNGRCVDGTVRNRLDAMNDLLKNTVL